MPKKTTRAPRRDGGLPTKSEIIEFLKVNEADVAQRDLARAFGVKGEDRADLRRLDRELERDGAVARRGRRMVRLDSLPEVSAVDVMSVDDDGDLVCLPADWRGEKEPPMIRVRASRAARLSPAPGVGDRLLARLKPAGDEGYEADILKALGRGAHRFLAVLRKERGAFFADPVERRTRARFVIERGDERGAKDGDLVWVETKNARGYGPQRGRVRDVAGHIDDRASYSLIALAIHGIPVEFPAAALEEAEAAKPPTLAGRVDLRDTPLLTIDPEDARDHDDAVWAACDDDPANPGGFRLIVAIADVSWFVLPGGALDREAQRRGNSVYLPDRVVPMLPERLSNDLCSLKEGVHRACIAVEMQISKTGRKLSHRFTRAMMRSAAKLSYGAAQKIIEGGQGPRDIVEVVRTLHAAFRARWNERAKRAPLDLDLPERKIILDSEGKVTRVERRERFDAHRLIEEFMILANIAAAETLEERRTPRIYRVHDAPDPEKLDATRDYLASLGYSLAPSGSLRPSNFNHILKLAGERDEKEMVSEVVLRSQRQAVYSTENLGHFGLNIPRYAHFTSPIRRYADLTVHRALVTAARLGKGGQTAEEAARLQKIAEDISDLERRAMAAERESTDRYLAAYLVGRIGAEFEGRIRGVTRFGLFVTLDETGADGFIPAQALHGRFFYVEERHALVAPSGQQYRLGQPVRVRLAAATPVTGGMRFEMVSEPIEGGVPPLRRSKSRGRDDQRTARKKGVSGRRSPARR
ncbi:MAG: ribonuclease R [Parvularculaceae bacterium]|nr:ribonuclease R [Parvularculaceae bacterium]